MNISELLTKLESRDVIVTEYKEPVSNGEFINVTATVDFKDQEQLYLSDQNIGLVHAYTQASFGIVRIARDVNRVFEDRVQEVKEALHTSYLQTLEEKEPSE